MTFENNTLKKPYTQLQYAKFASYCNKNNLIIVEFDNELKGIKQKPNLDDTKKEKLNSLKINVENYFYNNYPQYKQNNIAIFGTEEEKEEFKKFHSSTVYIYDYLIKQINEAETEEQLNKIKIDEDEFEKSPF